MWLSYLFNHRKKKKSSRSRGEPKLMSDSNYESPSKKRRPKKSKYQWLPDMLRWLGRKLLLPFIAVILIGIIYIWYDLPSISTLGELKKTPSITVKAEDGTIIGTYGDVYGDMVPYSQLPKSLIQAVVATEDRNFFHHFGVDPLGLLRATYVNIRAHHVVQGGSTITQQLAKNAFLTSERTMKRKFQEMILALELEHRFSKETIVTIYLNRVYMGAGNYGVDAASKRYFGHSVRTLSLNEAAILIGLLKAPSRYAPTSNPELSEKRATQVLFNMMDAGYITRAQFENAKNDLGDEDVVYRDAHGFGSFYFSDFVVSQVSQLIGEIDTDIVVTTTLRPDWQHMAEDAVSDVLASKGQALKASQGALLAMTPDGAIRAMVGGKNYRASQFNRATQGLRQPGSSFKLFVYLAALENGFLPTSEMEDKPISVGNWHPKDYTGKYEGRMTIRDAFAQSINSIAVQLSEAVGRGRVVEMAERLGITSEMNPDPSIALGTNEATLLDMTRGYAHLASGGKSVMPYSIARIESSTGKLIFERNTNVSGSQVLQTPIVGMMNNMMMAVTTIGTGRAAQIGRPVAGKTGTTSDYRDAWFIGFAPQLVTGVWVGNDNTSPMKKVTGGSLPAIIWHQFMMNVLKNAPVIPIPSQADTGTGGGLMPWMGLQPNPSLPKEREEEPAPEYNAPPSFWEKLMGDDKNNN
jgi:penicillin-binding protein 1A